MGFKVGSCSINISSPLKNMKKWYQGIGIPFKYEFHGIDTNGTSF